MGYGDCCRLTNVMVSFVAPLGVYLHIPFCARKCGYCDFNAYSGYKDGTKARYVDALCQEIARRGDTIRPVTSVFFGGGTPTELSAPDLRRILHTVQEHFAVTQDAEITTEANPGDACPAYLADLRHAGFNRLSFGVQTFHDDLLRLIDRVHTASQARAAVQAAKDAGFSNLSLDLMFALPRQTLSDWDRTLDSAFALDVPHLSMYALIVEEGTPFFARRERGRLTFPSEKTEAAMLSRAIDRATAAGYHHYEISNYARPGFESRHNQVYWRNEEYVGIGAGAASYLGGTRTLNVKRPSTYIETIQSGAPLFADTETLSLDETLGETLMVGLRMTRGVNLDVCAARFGVRVEDRFQDVIKKHTATGLLETIDGQLRLTRHGLFLGSEVMADFLP